MKPLQWKWVKLAALVAGLAAAAVALRAAGVNWSELTPEQVRAGLQRFGWWSPLIYIVAFGQPLIPLPGSIMAMAAGLLFGMGGGFAAAWIAAALRGCGQFFLARICGREAIATLLRGRLAAWDERMGHDGFQTVFWIRVVPNLPYDMQNFGLGCSRVPFGTFLAATALGLVPGLLVWVYLGYTLSDYSQLWKIGLGLLAVAGLWMLQHYYRNRRVVSS